MGQKLVILCCMVTMQLNFHAVPAMCVAKENNWCACMHAHACVLSSTYQLFFEARYAARSGG